jgi:hypothetical protein
MKRYKKNKKFNLMKLRYIFAVVATVLVVLVFQTWESFLPNFLYPIIEMFISLELAMPNSVPNSEFLVFTIVVFPTILFYFLIGLGVEKLVTVSKSKK